MTTLKELLVKQIEALPDERLEALGSACFSSDAEMLRQQVYRIVDAIQRENPGAASSANDRVALVFARLLEALTTPTVLSGQYNVSSFDAALMDSIIQKNSNLLHRLAK